MNPSPEDARPGPHKKTPLPPELAFLAQIPDPSLQGKELVQYGQNYLDRIMAHRELMQKHGLDPQRFLLALVPLVLRAQAAQAALAALEESQDALLGSMADQADATRNLFHALRPIVEQLHADKPFDPQTQEFKELIDEWAKVMPAE